MRVLGQMALTAVVLGTATAVLATGRVTASLVASTTLMWSWVPVVQLLTGLLLVGGGGPRRREALAEYFATGRYWLLWLLAFAAAVLLAPRPFSVILWAVTSAAIPLLLTCRELVRFRRHHFGDSLRAAWRRVLVHQAVTHAVVVLYLAWAVALWPRILGAVRG